jgi:hypothetical protein
VRRDSAVKHADEKGNVELASYLADATLAGAPSPNYVMTRILLRDSGKSSRKL